MRRFYPVLTTVAVAAGLLVAVPSQGRPIPGNDPTPESTTSTTTTTTTATATAQTASADGPIRGIFYYPWFPETWHADDRFTPTRGKYSNDDAAVLDAQFEDMAYAGMDVAISSWWGHGTVTGKRLESVIRAGEAHGVGVVPYYEKEYGDQDPSLAELRADLVGLEPLTSRPGWLKVDGKPVIFVYNAGATGCSDVSRWKSATNGWQDFYVSLKVFPGFEDCADQPSTWHQYGPASSRSEHLPWSSNVSPGFWHHEESQPRLPRSLSRFEADLRAQVASGAQWQLVTSYSEWGEGTAVESAEEWSSASGRGKYLDVMREVHLAADSGASERPATRTRSQFRVVAAVDAHVNAARPGKNYGKARTLAVSRSPVQRAYLRFRLSEPPQRAWLRLWVTRGNEQGVLVRRASSKWREGRINYRNAPDPGRLLGRLDRTRAGTWIKVDVTKAVRRAGKHSFVVSSRGGSAAFNSSERDRRRPHLLIRSSSTSGDGAVVWTAGDLCDNHDAPECAAVGKLISADSDADRFLALGDLQYEDGSTEEFRRYYEPALGHLKSMTLPAPGNHEYLTPGASGYFDYFGSRAGPRDKGYYATTVGAWRILVVNTQCGEAGGCDPDDPQGRWIREQLASSPKCTLLAGHHPAISDGKYAPGTDSGMQMLEYAYAGGAELYLAGHDHEYQRFPRLDAGLRPDASRGVRTFVVGTGGKNLTEWSSSTPRSDYRQNTSDGALRLVLRPGGYSWEFHSVDGSVMDRGSDTCH